MRNRLFNGIIVVLLAGAIAATGSPVQVMAATANSVATAAPPPARASATQIPARVARTRGLTVTVSAPEGVLPKVTITGPNGWARTVHGTTHFPRARVGYYRVSAATRRFSEGTAVPRVLNARLRVGRTHGAVSRVRYDTVIAPETTVVPGSKVEDLTTQTDGTQLLEVSGAPTATVGSVVVTGASDASPTGLVSRVQSVDEGVDSTAYTVVPAKLTEAFTDLSFSQQVTIDLDGSTAVSARTGDRVLTRGLTSYVQCDSGANFDVTPAMTGSVSLNFSAHYSALDPGNSWLRAEAAANVTATLGAHLDAAGTCAIQKQQLGPTVHFQPITFTIGPVPVVIVPTLQFFGEASASLNTSAGIDITGSLTSRAWAQASLTGGVTHGFEPPAANFTKDITYPQDVSGQLKGQLSARLTTELYGVAGPHVELNTGPQVNFAPTQVPWLDAEQLLSVDIGLNMHKCAEIWGADLCVKFEAEVDDVVHKSWPLYRREYIAAPSITSTQLPPATRSRHYDATLTTADNRQGSWRVSSGSLPAGLNLSGNKLTGTPSTAGAFSFSVRFTDGDGRSDEQPLTLTVLTEAAADIPANSIIRRSDGVSWVVDANKVRHHIPYSRDDTCWRLLRGYPVSATGLTAAQARALPEAEPWPCVVGPRVVKADDGKSYFVDSSNTRHWIPDTETFTALSRSYPVVGPWPAGEVANFLPGSDQPRVLDPEGVKNSIICRSDGVCWAVDGNAVRHHIPTYGDNVCWRWVNGWHVSRNGVSGEQADSLREADAWGCSMNGRIIATNEGAAYYMEGNTRRWIQDGYDFDCLQRGRSVIRGIAMSEATGIPEGTWMPAQDCAGIHIVTIYSPSNSRYVTTEINYGGADYAMVRAARTSVGSDWERFRLIGDCSSRCLIQSLNNRKLVMPQLDYQGYAWGEMRGVSSNSGGTWEGFRLVGDCNSGCAILALGNGRYVSTELDYTGNGYGMLRARATGIGGWERFIIQ